MPALDFKKQFADAVKAAEKKQTVRPVRPKDPIKAGDKLILSTGKRTKFYKRLRETVCTATAEVVIREHSMERDGAPLSVKDAEALAQVDGFRDFAQFAAFFKNLYGLPFAGVLIQWE